MSDKSGQQGLITHTSGPWDASHDADGDYAIFSFGGILVCVTDSDTDEDKANARLIAAAPDMLDALKAAQTSLRAWNVMGMSVIARKQVAAAYENSPEMKAIAAAIRKAEEGQ